MTRLHVDRTMLSGHFAPRIEPPSLDRVAVPHPGSWREVEAVQELAGRLLLKRLLSRVAVLAEGSEVARWQPLVDALLALPSGRATGLARGPVLSAWTVALNDDIGWSPDTARSYLARAVVPALAVFRPDWTTPAFDLGPADGQPIGIELPGVAVLRIDGSALDLTIEADRGVLVLRSEGEELWAWRPAGAMLEIVASSPRVRVQVFPSVNGVFATPVDGYWCATRIAGAPEPALDQGIEEIGAFCGTFRESLAVIETTWPDAWREVVRTVQRILPLPPAGAKPGYCAHRTRGVIWARRGLPVECAQILVHEAGHNFLCSIIDVFELAENPRAIVRSPIGEDRPVWGVFHAACSFTREACFTRRLFGFTSELSLGRPLETYFEQVKHLATESLVVLDRHAAMTEGGRALTDGMRAALEELS